MLTSSKHNYLFTAFSLSCIGVGIILTEEQKTHWILYVTVIGWATTLILQQRQIRSYANHAQEKQNAIDSIKEARQLNVDVNIISEVNQQKWQSHFLGAFELIGLTIFTFYRHLEIDKGKDETKVDEICGSISFGLAIINVIWNKWHMDHHSPRIEKQFYRFYYFNALKRKALRNLNADDDAQNQQEQYALITILWRECQRPLSQIMRELLDSTPQLADLATLPILDSIEELQPDSYPDNLHEQISIINQFFNEILQQEATIIRLNELTEKVIAPQADRNNSYQAEHREQPALTAIANLTAQFERIKQRQQGGEWRIELHEHAVQINRIKQLQAVTVEKNKLQAQLDGLTQPSKQKQPGRIKLLKRSLAAQIKMLKQQIVEICAQLQIENPLAEEEKIDDDQRLLGEAPQVAETEPHLAVNQSAQAVNQVIDRAKLFIELEQAAANILNGLLDAIPHEEAGKIYQLLADTGQIDPQLALTHLSLDDWNNTLSLVQ